MLLAEDRVAEAQAKCLHAEEHMQPVRFCLTCGAGVGAEKKGPRRPLHHLVTSAVDHTDCNSTFSVGGAFVDLHVKAFECGGMPRSESAGVIAEHAVSTHHRQVTTTRHQHPNDMTIVLLFHPKLVQHTRVIVTSASRPSSFLAS